MVAFGRLWWLLFAEPALWAMMGSAIFLVMYASWRSHQIDRRLFKAHRRRRRSGQTRAPVVDNRETIDGWGKVIWLPVVASVILLIMFFLAPVQIILKILISIGSVYALMFSLAPIVFRLRKALSLPYLVEFPWKRFGKMPLHIVASFLLAIGTVIAWLATRPHCGVHNVRDPASCWILNNTLAFSLCIAGPAFIRFKNVKTISVLLGLLFVYDIFWVFVSPYLFQGRNVMVEVATGYDLPIKLEYPRIFGALPRHVNVRGYLFLGLGDIVLPTLLVSHALRYDYFKSKRWTNGYYLLCSFGYAAGLASAFFILAAFSSAQPALIYLVPGTLVPVCVLAYHRGELTELWHGVAKSSENDRPISSNPLDVPASPTAIGDSAPVETIEDADDAFLGVDEYAYPSESHQTPDAEAGGEHSPLMQTV